MDMAIATGGFGSHSDQGSDSNSPNDVKQLRSEEISAKLRRLNLSSSSDAPPAPVTGEARRPGGRVRPSRTWLIAAIMLTQAAALGYLIYDRNNGSGSQVSATDTANADRTNGADTTRAIAGSGPVEFEAQGFTIATRRATVSARVAGIVSAVMIEVGDRVGKGDVIGTLDASLARQDVALARERMRAMLAHVASAEAQLRQARGVEGRYQALYDRGFATLADYERVTAESNVAQANLGGLRADLAGTSIQIAQQNSLLDNYTIRAPFAGIVIEKNAQPGELLAPSGAGGGFTRTGLATIIDMDSLEVVVDVGEQFVTQVKPGRPVSVGFYALPDLIITGRVSRIMPSADRAKGTVQVRVTLDATDPRILPDMGTKVSFLRCSQKECPK